MDLAYGTSSVRLSGEYGPDAPITWSEFSIGSIRRSYAGAARSYELWDKRRVPLKWTGISSAVSQIFRDVKNYGTTLVLTDLPAPVQDALGGTLYMLYVPGTYSISESGYDSYDLSMTLEEQ